MACASFLKHNNGLTKRGSGSHPSTQSKNLTNEKKQRQRHSVEVISTSYLDYKQLEAMENSNANVNANRNIAKYLADVTGSGGLIEAIPEDSEARPDKPLVDTDVDLNPVPGLPATLGQLVLLWEGIVLR